LNWWSVSIETRGDDPAGMTADDRAERLGELVNMLVPHSGVVVGGGEPVRWGATISVEADTAVTAITDATEIIRSAGSDVFLPDWPTVRAEAIREDVLDEEQANDRHITHAPLSN